MARTNLDRLKIVASLCRGENITEEFNSERTAKAEWNNIVRYGFPKNLVLRSVSEELSKYCKDSYLYNRVLEKYGKVDDEVISLIAEIDEFCIKNRCFDLKGENPADGHKGELYLCKFHHKPVSGVYTVTYKNETNTKKYQQYQEYENAVDMYVKELGLCYEPDGYPFEIRKYNNTTEVSYSLHTKKIFEKIQQGIVPCSEKQAYWISKNMNNVSVEQAQKLNKAQASELLDCLFNMDVFHPYYKEIISHYRRILS